MKRILLALGLICAPVPLWADATSDMIRDVVENHIQPRYATLADTSAALARAAQTDCSAASPPLRDAYQTAFDAWVAVSHLRFGPSEVDNRAFALAFWPDSRGATPKTLAALIADADPVAATPEAFADVSIAARGFYALEFLLYDDAFATGDASYRCTLMQTVTGDIAALTQAILDDWQTGFAETLLTPGADSPYRSTDEVAQELFKALDTGLEFTADTRLGRPLGTFDRPRPTRAEAWRSGRSLRNVVVSLETLRDLSLRLSQTNPDLQAAFEGAFDKSLTRAATLDDPVFAGAADPQSRLRIEVLQQSVFAARDLARQDLGPLLGVASGFNALDGD
jgi:uncharacterized protein